MIHSSIIILNTDTDHFKIKNDNKIQTAGAFKKNEEANFSAQSNFPELNQALRYLCQEMRIDEWF